MSNNENWEAEFVERSKKILEFRCNWLKYSSLMMIH